MTSVASESVHDYTVAREAQVRRLEAVAMTVGPPSDPDVAASGFYARTGAADLGGETPLTYKAWLRQTRPESPQDRDAVRRVARTLVLDAHHRVRETEIAYLEACEIRDMEIADAMDDAHLTARDLAPLLRTSFQTVAKLGKRGREARR